MSFYPGFSTITGETGSGKSILLGALSLVLGKRADKTVIRDSESKCVVEAEWDIDAHDLSSFFVENDLDYEAQCIIRREITVSGKSRAFVNDSPVSLSVLVELGGRLLDIHSQNETAELFGAEFQLSLLDAWGQNKALTSEYRERFYQWKRLRREWEELNEKQLLWLREQDYQQFLLTELEEARLDQWDVRQLEQEREEQSNCERIRAHLSEIEERMDAEELGLLAQLRRLSQLGEELSAFSDRFKPYRDRLLSSYLDLQDLHSELVPLADSIELNPARLEELESTLELLYRLMTKHQVNQIDELIQLRTELRGKLEGFEDNLSRMAEIQAVMDTMERELRDRANELSQRRSEVVDPLVKKAQADLSRLGMPNARLEVVLERGEQLTADGLDRIEILFSANPGQQPGSLRKVASGGERSRMMLVLKSILARRQQLPTLIFDEIDTGVSGQISDQMGRIMKEMGEDMQVISITHIPQIAARGAYHYKVSKDVNGDSTHSRIDMLTEDQRVEEVAEMLSGKNPGESARAHALELLRSESRATRDI